jgi:hypothetical protein
VLCFMGVFALWVCLRGGRVAKLWGGGWRVIDKRDAWWPSILFVNKRSSMELNSMKQSGARLGTYQQCLQLPAFAEPLLLCCSRA